MMPYSTFEENDLFDVTMIVESQRVLISGLTYSDIINFLRFMRKMSATHYSMKSDLTFEIAVHVDKVENEHGEE